VLSNADRNRLTNMRMGSPVDIRGRYVLYQGARKSAETRFQDAL